jgi:hypothetical protein
MKKLPKYVKTFSIKQALIDAKIKPWYKAPKQSIECVKPNSK